MRKRRRFFCYIVECADGTLYTGWTVDVEARVKTHNAGRGARYTKTRRPVKLVYTEPQPTHAAALKREAQIKRLRREAKFALTQSGRSMQRSEMTSGLKTQRRKGAKPQRLQ